MSIPASDDQHSAAGTSSTALVRASEAYVNRPVFRALMDMAAQAGGFTLEACGFTGASVGIPLAYKAADTTLAKAVSMVRKRQAAHRATMLNVELSEAGTGLPVDALTDDRFLHAYDVTLRAALRTYRDEKIRLFARLLASASTGDAITDMDEYEELLAVLDDMSMREIQILTTLARHSPVENRDDWAAFIAEVERLPGIRSDEVSAMLARLNRTGLYSTLGGTYNDLSGRGKLTPRYYRLRDLIADPDGNVTTPDRSTDSVAPTMTTEPH